jgi:hypothetical protein
VASLVERASVASGGSVQGTPSAESVSAMLSSARECRGIGPVLASRIVSKFGPARTLEIFERREFGDLRVVKGVSQRVIDGLAHSANTMRHGPLSDARAALLFAHSHGLPPGWMERLRRAYGSWSAALAVVRRAPFQILGDVPGLGFRAADRIALAVATEARSEAKQDRETGAETGRDNGMSAEAPAWTLELSGLPLYAPPRPKAVEAELTTKDGGRGGGKGRAVSQTDRWWIWWRSLDAATAQVEGAGMEDVGDVGAQRLRAALRSAVFDAVREGHVCSTHVGAVTRALRLIWSTSSRRSSSTSPSLSLDSTTAILGSGPLLLAPPPTAPTLALPPTNV